MRFHTGDSTTLSKRRWEWFPDITRRTVNRRFGRAFHEAVENADQIHFSLDGIAPDKVYDAVRSGASGFVPGNMTNAELHYIYNNVKALSKTIFYRGGEVVPNPFTLTGGLRAP